ncbi:hypothetical protein [Lentzea sp. NPDC059081]|uniref:hypothetical protein n=1 Tax=Lentzea sp. NPDC059081 TaxID=3346719 RepID=UPI00369CA6F3
MDDDVHRAARKIREVEQAVTTHAANTGPITGQASSPDGAVTVTATPAGPPQQITVTPASLRMGPHALAAEIMRIAAKAQLNANTRLHQTLNRVVDPEELTAMGIENVRDDDEYRWRP